MAKDSDNITYIWKDKKRFLGMPITFTKYALSQDRLFVETGFFTSTLNETLLYRIKDLTIRTTLWQKIFGVGTIIIHSSDKTESHFEIKNIKRPKYVKELIHTNVEKNKTEKNMRLEENLSTNSDCNC